MSVPTLTPMLHVPDIRATADWYRRLGFEVLDIGEDDGEAVFALLSYAGNALMLNTGGRAAETRRDADLYVQTTGVDALFAALPEGVDVVEPPYDAFYGMREFIIRDLNGFWLTFGERPVA